MLDSILDTVKGEIGDTIKSKFGLDSTQTDGVFSIAGETISDTIAKESAGGAGVDGLLNLFSSDTNDAKGNDMLGSLASSLVGQFSSKLGIGEEKSSGIADMLLSKVTSLIGNKLGGNLDVSSLLSLVGGKSEGLGGMIGKIGGLFS